VSENRKKQPRMETKRQAQRDSAEKSVKNWPLQLVLTLLIGIVIGFALRGVLIENNSIVPSETTVDQSPNPTEASDGGGPTDAYGRAPGDPHYGHPHP